MPVTAKLSRKLYETFGDEAASEMVDWMHYMDTQRADLRELSELHLARFDSRAGDLRQEMVARFNEQHQQMDARFDRVDTRIDGLATEMSAGSLSGKRPSSAGSRPKSSNARRTS